MRELTIDELSLVSGGDDGGCGVGCGDGGDCSSGGDCSVTSTADGAVCSFSGGAITCAESVGADGVASITVTGSGFGQGLGPSQSAQFGALLGSATGLTAFVAGVLPASMTLGEAMAIGGILGGVAGVAAVGVVAALATIYGFSMAEQSTGP